MRLVIARCSVDYTGRLSAHLPLATRLLLVKADGSVLVHSDGGAYKPLNWMSAPCTLVQEPDAWRVSNRTGESMTIHIEEILHDSSHDLGVDPGLVKDGVERHLQELLADRCTVLGDGWSLVRREYPTDIGPVDLLCRDDQGAYVAVEIKRRGEIDGLEQLAATWSASAPPWVPSGASSPPRPSPSRPGPWPRPAVSTASPWTTTPSAAWSRTPRRCSSRRPAPPTWLTAAAVGTILAGRWFARPCFTGNIGRASPKRESGAIPELPRSGKWERQPSPRRRRPSVQH